MGRETIEKSIVSITPVGTKISRLFPSHGRPMEREFASRQLQPYSPSMEALLANGYKAKKRPSGHDISEKFNINNGATIPPNLNAWCELLKYRH
jgi:hypothetical protein